MYNVLPETENRSLEEIELHFADNSKPLWDWKIAKKPHSLDRIEILKEHEVKKPFLGWVDAKQTTFGERQ